MEQTLKPLYQSLETHCQDISVQCQSTENIEVMANFVFEETFSGFDGHFPGQPVLPGIIQLATVRFLAEHGLKQQLTPVSYNSTKFRGVIFPNEKLHVRITLKQHETTWKGAFTIEKHEQDNTTSVVTKGQCEFSPETGDSV
ncbi:hypothetical protein [Desulfosediminicola flagellatus]|uniref:ApeI family dehydratase n=1 Tax=Desulfosediminicola flagellatus TaxID=2569541 RepID=UPI0010AB5D0D|nr:hypothetical protein [Desulfosediminicola flagellatus]